jgi:hypothetical protein
MGGTLTLESQLGKGSTFTLDLPSPPLRERDAGDEADATAPARRGGTALLADDDDGVRELLGVLLDGRRIHGLQGSATPATRSSTRSRTSRTSA